jgi:NAD-dependent deacetylase
MKRLVVLTGAGVSAESGLRTFRDSGGLWEGHDVMDVASPEGWRKNPGLVLQFYNERRKSALGARPNRAHEIIAELQNDFEVQVITQNVDDLHERAGSASVLHLHGKLFESRSTGDESLVYPVDGWEVKLGDTCEKGYQLRPNIVWFGEMVPLMEVAAAHASKADIFLVVGTSLVVYPAAGLIDYVPGSVPKFIVDPNKPDVYPKPHLEFIVEKASTGMEKFKEKVLKLK